MFPKCLKLSTEPRDVTSQQTTPVIPSECRSQISNDLYAFLPDTNNVLCLSEFCEIRYTSYLQKKTCQLKFIFVKIQVSWKYKLFTKENLLVKIYYRENRLSGGDRA